MKNIIIAAYSLIAAFIGAGFASGQELICYFVTFGRAGIIGVAVNAAVYTVYTYAILSICRKTNAVSLNAFLNIIPVTFIKKTVKLSVGIFAFAVFAVMLSAAGSLGSAFSSLPAPLCALAAAVCAVMLMRRGAQRILSLNGIIGLLLTAGIVTVCVYILRYREFHALSPLTRSLGSSYIYSGYNLISLSPAIVLLSEKLRTKHSPAAVSLISGGALFIMMSLMFLILSIYYRKTDLGEMPMLTMAYRQNKYLGAVYALLTAGAVMTTLLSSWSCVYETFSFSHRPFISVFTAAAAYLLSGLGFAGLVDTAYRVTGATGAVLVTVILIFCGKKLINKK